MSVPKKRPTLAEIARKAGVAKSTASMALRGLAKVGAEKRDEIKRIAAQMGYSPNPLVAAHMTHLRLSQAPKERETIGFVYDQYASLDDVAQKNEVSLQYYQGAKERAEALGYRLEFFSLKKRGMTHERLDQIMRARGVRGLIIPPLGDAKGVELRFGWSAYAVCCIGYTFKGPGFERVFYDGYATMRAVLQHVSDFGYKRIGLAVFESEDQFANQAWSTVFSHHLRTAKPGGRVEPLISPTLDKQGFAKWLGREKPDAIIAHRPRIYDWVLEMGLKAPDDIGFAVLLGVPNLRDQLSGYYHKLRSISATAVDSVAAQLSRNERGIPETSKVTYVRGEWSDGESLSPR